MLEVFRSSQGELSLFAGWENHDFYDRLIESHPNLDQRLNQTKQKLENIPK